tara:strand:+ start:584 stop:760 length:177 start_codon:yes stop_codon:yes gene_type:complete
MIGRNESSQRMYAAKDNRHQYPIDFVMYVGGKYIKIMSIVLLCDWVLYMQPTPVRSEI